MNQEAKYEAKYCAHCEARIIFDSTTPPDPLALQARVHQLEAALKMYEAGRKELLEKKDTTAFVRGERAILGALSAPPLDVSPLWEILSIALAESTHNLALFNKVKALTPELRALIATITNSYSQAKGGQE